MEEKHIRELEKVRRKEIKVSNLERHDVEERVGLEYVQKFPVDSASKSGFVMFLKKLVIGYSNIN